MRIRCLGRASAMRGRRWFAGRYGCDVWEKTSRRERNARQTRGGELECQSSSSSIGDAFGLPDPSRLFFFRHHDTRLKCFTIGMVGDDKKKPQSGFTRSRFGTGWPAPSCSVSERLPPSCSWSTIAAMRRCIRNPGLANSSPKTAPAHAGSRAPLRNPRPVAQQR